MFRRICLAFGLAAACLNVSAKPQPLPMPLAADLPVEVVLNQQELAVDVAVISTAIPMQFGLLGALVGSAVQSGIQNAQVKKAEERVVPLRDQLIAYRFNERLETALRAKIVSEGLSPNPVITVMKTPWDAVNGSQDAQAVPLHALVLTPRYSIDSNFNRLAVALTAQLVNRKINPNGKIKTSYLFSRTYTFQFPLVESESEDNLQRWTAMGTVRLGELLDQGITQATDMLVHDFSAAGRVEWEQITKRQHVMLKGQEYEGLAVRQSPDWAWVRAGKGRSQTLQGYQPVSEPVAVVAPAEVAVPATAIAAPVEVAAPAAALPEAAVDAGAVSAPSGG